MRSPGALLATAAALAAGAAPAQAATRLVDNDRRQCPAAQFTTIQAAVDAAGPGDTVKVCDGVYPELVQIGVGAEEPPDDKPGLRVTSKTRAGATVRSARPFFVDGSEDHVSGLEISRFRVEGPGPSTGAGILLRHVNRVLVEDNLIRGVAVGVDQRDGVTSAIRRNLITEFGETGVRAETGSSMSVGTRADLQFNTVVGGPASTGVRFFGSGLGGFSSRTFGSLFGNTISGNGAAGLHVIDSTVEVKANEVFGNGIGLSIDNYFGGTIANNKVNGNSRQGILMLDGGNQLSSNNARGNGGIDCEDRTAPGGPGTAGTENTWTGNLGHESDPPGICRRTNP